MENKPSSNLWLKIGCGTLAVLFLAAFAFIIKLQFDLKAKQNAQDQTLLEMKQFKDNIVRSETHVVDNEQLQQFAKDLNFKMDNIQKDLDALGAQVMAINNVTVTTPGFHGTGLPSTNTTPLPDTHPAETPCTNGTCPNPDIYGYLDTIQELSIYEPFSNTLKVPFGSVQFNARESNPWSEDIFPREYSTTTVIAQDEDGNSTAYSQVSITVDGKTYDVPIAKAKMMEKKPENKWRFSPRVFLGISAGAKVTGVPAFEATPELTVSFGSYGPNINTPEFVVGGVGVGYHAVNQLPALVITPINYRIGKHIPFMPNLYIGPSVSIDTSTNVVVSGGIRADL